MQAIAGPHRSNPAKRVNAEAYQGMGTERARLYGEAHCNRRGMPSRRRQTFEDRVFRGLVVQVKRLRVIFRGKLLYFSFRVGSLLNRMPTDKSSNHSTIVNATSQ